MNIDKRIYDANLPIVQNIELFDNTSISRATVAQNLLSLTRTLVEKIIYKIFLQGEEEDYDWNKQKEAIEYLKRDNKYLFLREFYRYLQESVSHYTPDDEGAERLLIKYYPYFVMLREFAKKEFELSILHNIEKVPIDMDDSISVYQSKIAELLDKEDQFVYTKSSQRFYVQKVKPFVVNGKVYFEVIISPAYDTASKFDRFVCYSRVMLPKHYAIKATIDKNTIMLEGNRMPINIIQNYNVSIRPCELKNYAKLLGVNAPIGSHLLEYQGLMTHLTASGETLLDIVLSSEKEYQRKKDLIFDRSKARYFEPVLDNSRQIILNDNAGGNLLRYLLYTFNNRIIKAQFGNDPLSSMSNLYVDWGCIPFDTMPFASSLKKHNPSYIDLINCVPLEKHKPELIAHWLQTNMTEKSCLYCKKSDLMERFDDVDRMIQIYNSMLYKKHTGRKIESFGDNLYVKEAYDSTKTILSKIKYYSSKSVKGYEQAARQQLTDQLRVDSEEKRVIIERMYSDTRAFLLYGSAGTGKSYLINIMAQLFAEHSKLLLANTNPAVDNLRRKVTAKNCTFMTISRYLLSSGMRTEYDILIVDECSMVGNKDMASLLKKVNCKIMLLVGDVHQIESIVFGNWFALARYFIPKSSWAELTCPFRTTEENLLELWKKVRFLESDITEWLVMYQFSTTLDSSVFDPKADDEIVLCLNYDGLYGINSINRFMQENNPNPSFMWGLWSFKKGDPVLFNETNRFSNVLYNNLKGEIIEIELCENNITFTIKIAKALTELDVDGTDLVLLSTDNVGESTIKFSVFKKNDEEDSSSANETDIPFQIAYAVSIHKAQGLEYDSVKIIITKDMDEMITHNIFYTAITRARKALKIYWSPETQEKVLRNMEVMDLKNDAIIFSAQSGMKMNKRVQFD